MPAMTNAEALADAEAKYHQLMTGSLARVFVDQNGERVEFTATNKANLYAYILSLRNTGGGVVEYCGPRPLGFTFP